MRGAGSPAAVTAPRNMPLVVNSSKTALAGQASNTVSPSSRADAEVHVESVNPEPLEQPVIGRQELAGVAVEVQRAEVHQPAHGRASSTMLNGAAGSPRSCRQSVNATRS